MIRPYRLLSQRKSCLSIPSASFSSLSYRNNMTTTRRNISTSKKKSSSPSNNNSNSSHKQTKNNIDSNNNDSNSIKQILSAFGIGTIAGICGSLGEFLY